MAIRLSLRDGLWGPKPKTLNRGCQLPQISDFEVPSMRLLLLRCLGPFSMGLQDSYKHAGELSNPDPHLPKKEKETLYTEFWVQAVNPKP